MLRALELSTHLLATLTIRLELLPLVALDWIKDYAARVDPIPL